jgi:hypothetical protein
VLLEVSLCNRLKASAATVLSRRGAVIPHVQREQHQPLKSSSSIQIRCLFIQFAFARVGIRAPHATDGTSRGESYHHRQSSTDSAGQPSTKSAATKPRPKGHDGRCPDGGLDTLGHVFCVARSRVFREGEASDSAWSWEGKGAFSTRLFFGTRVARSLAVQKRSTPLWRAVGCAPVESRAYIDRSSNRPIRFALACRSGRFHRRAETFCVRSTSLTRVAHRWCLRR